jgi:starch synthase
MRGSLKRKGPSTSKGTMASPRSHGASQGEPRKKGPRKPRPARSARIVHLTAEYWPYIRTGGLAEAVRGMASFQSLQGSEVTILLPLFQRIREGDHGLKPVGDSFSIQVGPRAEEGRLWEATKGSDGPRVLLLENDHYFGRSGVYGEGGQDYPDNHLRFSFLAAAAVQVLPDIAPGQSPVVLHMHDWHTALAVVYLRTLGQGDAYADGIATVLSVHNGGFQGHFPADSVPQMGLPWELYTVDCMEWYGRANILKAGLVFTDMATTVSPSHSFELRTEAGGFGLHDTFLALHDRLAGVLNGIDFRIWDSETDPYIPANYSRDDLSGKAQCKAALQEGVGFPQEPDRLVIGMVARMVAQKGMDLILGGRAIREADAQFVFLGAGERRYEEGLMNLAAAHPDRVAVELSFTEKREHQILAGADALLMPSLYEPCGLTQMKALRYGTPPLARRVGGLDDTIEDGTTGLLFDDYKPERLDWIVERAVFRYRKPASWQDMAKHGMARDFSWDRVVTRYFAIYDQALEIRADALVK